MTGEGSRFGREPIVLLSRKKEKERGKTVIYSTHYMEEADYLCDRIVMLNKGKTICDASPEELKKQNGVSSMRDAFYRIIESEGISYEV